MEFIRKFGTETIAKEMDVATWLINYKDNYYI
jgi:hypothetical protein